MAGARLDEGPLEEMLGKWLPATFSAMSRHGDEGMAMFRLIKSSYTTWPLKLEEPGADTPPATTITCEVENGTRPGLCPGHV